MIAVYHLKHVDGLELVEVVDKHVAAHYPLPVVLAPHGFAPARVGQGEVQRVLVEVVPVLGRDDVPQRVEKVVGHHLGLAAGAAGEVHERGVVVGVDVLGAVKGGCLVEALVEVVPALRHAGAGRDAHLDRRALGLGRYDVVDDHVVAHGHDGLDGGGVAAIHDVARREQVGSRYGHCAQLVQGGDGPPPLVAAFHDEHHHVAVPYAQLLEEAGGLVAVVLDVGKGELVLEALVVGPQQGFLVGLDARPLVDHVVGKVEILGNLDVKILHEVLVGIKVYLV